MLSAMQAALEAEDFDATRAQYSSMRSVCKAWRQALLLELCPRTCLFSKPGRIWECPFPSIVMRAVKVETWSQLNAIADIGHEVETIYLNKAGRVRPLQALMQ